MEQEIVCPFCEGTEFDYIESVVAFHKRTKISDGKIVIGKKPDDYWEDSERGALLQNLKFYSELQYFTFTEIRMGISK